MADDGTWQVTSDLVFPGNTHRDKEHYVIAASAVDDQGTTVVTTPDLNVYVTDPPDPTYSIAFTSPTAGTPAGAGIQGLTQVDGSFSTTGGGTIADIKFTIQDDDATGTSFWYNDSANPANSGWKDYASYYSATLNNATKTWQVKDIFPPASQRVKKHYILTAHAMNAQGIFLPAEQSIDVYVSDPIPTTYGLDETISDAAGTTFMGRKPSTDQQVIQSVAAGQTSVFYVGVINDSSPQSGGPDTITIGIESSVNGTSAFSTHCNLTASNTAADGTSVINGSTISVGRGQSSYKLIRVSVTPDANAIVGNSFALGVTATGPGGKQDTVTTITKVSAFKVDATVSDAAGTNWSGSNLYTSVAPSTTQLATQSTALGSPATFYAAVVNRTQSFDGSSDTIMIQGPASLQGGAFTVQYFLTTGISASNGLNITDSASNGTGYPLDVVRDQPNYRLIRVIVTPTASAHAGDSATVSVTEKIKAAPTFVDNVSMVTSVQGLALFEYSLNNPSDTTYDPTATWSRSYPVIVAPDTRVSFHAVKTITTTDWPAGKPVWSGTAGITGAGEVKTKIFNLANQTPASATPYTVIAECGNSIPASVYVSAGGQPDIAVRNAGDTAYVGTGTFNTTNYNQVVGQAVRTGETAVYEFQLINSDTQDADTFLLKGSSSGEGYTVKFFDRYPVAGAIDISSQVQNAGYPVTLAPGGVKNVRAEVTQVSSNVNVTKDVLVNLISTLDGTKSDRAKLQVTLTGAQPDLTGRNKTSDPNAAYTGVNLTQNAETSVPTLSQIVGVGGNAIYELKLWNRSAKADTFVFTSAAPTDTAHFDVQFYDSLSGTYNISAPITGTPAQTPPQTYSVTLPAGGGKDLRVEVKVLPGTLGASVRDVTLNVASTTDPNRKDAITLHTAVQSAQPNVSVRAGGTTTFTGEALPTQSEAATTQLVAASFGQGIPATYQIKVANTSAVDGAFKLTGTGSSSSFKIDYYDSWSGGNAIASNGSYVLNVPANGTGQIRAVVTQLPGIALGAVSTFKLTATSTANAGHYDSIAMQTTYAAARPDLGVRVQSSDPSAAYQGLDPATTPPILSQAVVAGGTITYEMALWNRGPSTDYFTVSGPGSSNGFTINYYDAATNTDITAGVTGATYKVILAPGGVQYLRLKTTATTAAVGALSDVVVSAKSATSAAGDTSTTDSVEMKTAVQGSAKLQYSTDGKATDDTTKTWIDVPQPGQTGYPLTVNQRQYILFRAAKSYNDGVWPVDKPLWSGDGEANGQTGESVRLYFDTASTSDTDLKTVTAECGNSVSGKVKVLPKVRFKIISATTGATLSDSTRLDVAVYDDKIDFDQVALSIDGDPQTTSDPNIVINGQRSMFYWIHTYDFANGAHTLQVADSISSENMNVSFDNEFYNLDATPMFDSSHADPELPGTAQITATIAHPAQYPDWTIELEDLDGNVVKRFDDVPVLSGGDVTTSWDGRDANGNLPDGGTFVVNIYPRDNMTTRDVTSNPPPTKGSKFTMINNLTVTNHLAMIDADACAHGFPDAVTYAQFVFSKLQAIPAVIKPHVVLLDTFMVARSAATRSFINRQFQAPCVLIYVNGHGAAVSPGFHIGNYRWSAFKKPGPGYNDPKKMDMSAQAAPLKYGQPDGHTPPKLVWFDGCNTAGPMDKLHPVVSTEVAQAFGITSGSSSPGWGSTIGSYGEVAPYGTDGNGYDTWRTSFWNALTANAPNGPAGAKQSIYQSYAATCAGHPGIDSPLGSPYPVMAPGTTYRFYGQTASHF